MSGIESTPKVLPAPLDGAPLVALAAPLATRDRTLVAPEATAPLTDERPDAAEPVDRAEDPEPEAEAEPEPAAETGRVAIEVEPMLGVEEPSEPTRRTGAAVTMRLLGSTPLEMVE